MSTVTAESLTADFRRSLARERRAATVRAYLRAFRFALAVGIAVGIVTAVAWQGSHPVWSGVGHADPSPVSCQRIPVEGAHACKGAPRP